MTHLCKVCSKPYEDSVDEAFMCANCEDEYSIWLEDQGYVIGEFDDIRHPNYVPNPRAGTKWEVL
jgi:hypothetical protein